MDKSIRSIIKSISKAMILGIARCDWKAFLPFGLRSVFMESPMENCVSDATYGCANWVWQQDGAPSHASNIVPSCITTWWLEASIHLWSESGWLPYVVACCGEGLYSGPQEHGEAEGRREQDVSHDVSCSFWACIRVQGGFFEKNIV